MVGAESAEESQGRKDHGIPATYENMATKPWLRKRGWAEGRKAEVSKTLGFATELINNSDRSAARTLPKARLTYLPQLEGIYMVGLWIPPDVVAIVAAKRARPKARKY